MSNYKGYNILELAQPVVFPELNALEGKSADFERSALQVEKLKYKHLRTVQQYPEPDQMHHLLMTVTKLSENELGNLDADDAAKLTEMVYEAMKKYMMLGQRMMSGE